MRLARCLHARDTLKFSLRVKYKKKDALKVEASAIKYSSPSRLFRGRVRGRDKFRLPEPELLVRANEGERPHRPHTAMYILCVPMRVRAFMGRWLELRMLQMPNAIYALGFAPLTPQHVGLANIRQTNFKQ